MFSFNPLVLLDGVLTASEIDLAGRHRGGTLDLEGRIPGAFVPQRQDNNREQHVHRPAVGLRHGDGRTSVGQQEQPDRYAEIRSRRGGPGRRRHLLSPERPHPAILERDIR